MPQHWELELRTLLFNLGVLYDTSNIPAISASFDHQDAFESSTDDVDKNSDDRVALIKSEMESTLTLISELTQTGYMDEDIYRDILRVFHALMRPQNHSELVEADWYIESGAAILHFCRIVTRLSNALVRRRQ